MDDVLAAFGAPSPLEACGGRPPPTIGAGLARRAAAHAAPFLTHPVFHRYHSETEMLRYLRRLADRDVALDRAMIPLGSCTMKLNATTEMVPGDVARIRPAPPLRPARPGAATCS